MKALFIGGTGTISAAIVRRLVNELNWEVWLLNRGNRPEAVPEGARSIVADINDEADVLAKLGDATFDCVCEFIGFTPDQVERDYRLFKGRTRQYIYTSSASAYHKPAASYVITEGTTLANPYWQYSRDKIACEEFLMKKYREEGFPVTIVRPSHTYDERSVPLGVHGKKGSWQVVKRMLEGKPVIIQGDGTSLWTMTFNTDFAVGYTGLMGNRHAIGEAFQITGDETLTWNQIYATIADGRGGGQAGLRLHRQPDRRQGRVRGVRQQQAQAGRAGHAHRRALRPGRAHRGGLRAVPPRVPGPRPRVRRVVRQGDRGAGEGEILICEADQDFRPQSET